MLHRYRTFLTISILLGGLFSAPFFAHAERVEVSAETSLGKDIKIISEDEENLLSRYQEMAKQDKKEREEKQEAMPTPKKQPSLLPQGEILPKIPFKLAKASNRDTFPSMNDKTSKKEILPSVPAMNSKAEKKDVLPSVPAMNDKALKTEILPPFTKDAWRGEDTISPTHEKNIPSWQAEEGAPSQKSSQREQMTTKEEETLETDKKPLGEQNKLLPARDGERQFFNKILPDTAKDEATLKKETREQKEAEKKAKRLQKEALKADKAREKRLQKQRVRFQEIFFDDEYTYYVDTKTLKWKTCPHKSDEKILDVWVKAIPKKAAEGEKTYYLDHYYLRPQTEEIMFLAELEVTGRPQNNIQDIPYHIENFEKLIPESLEDNLYHAILDMIGYEDKSKNAKKDIFQKAKEFTEDTLRIYL